MPHSNHHQQFHANPQIFDDPYLNTPKKYLSSLETCPNYHIARCAPLNGPNNVIEHTHDQLKKIYSQPRHISVQQDIPRCCKQRG